VSSSEQSTRLLRGTASRCSTSTTPAPLPLYVDGADECDPHGRLIKGGGGALTREKIIAAASGASCASSTRARRSTCWAASRCRSR
jgi:ribose 5-phosphate isomerase A